ncbi:sorting nexin-6-like [Gigantopelta aegis]|uniref:sorting nexin-6-like n=1 Tax=Gigantopelta aegis TaxID=1735272 RepID=UPI001B88BCCA|nr:sorting nexin-6-like [Gigantopelta aegis]
MTKKYSDGLTNGSEGDSSADSTPTKSVPFSPVFLVQVSDAVKDGDTLQFTIMVTRVGEENGAVVTRVFEDLEWLHHCLITQNSVDGLIVPPLPSRPEVDPRSAESKSKKQLGSDTKILKGDEFSKDCRTVEKYLRLILKHESFGRDEALSKFLTEKEAPVRAKLKKGIMTRFSSTVEGVRKGGHRDIEDYFQKKREWAAEWGKSMKDVSGNFNKMVCAQYRVAGSFTHLATALTWTGAYKDDATVEINKVFSKLSEALDDARHGLEVLCNNDEKTLGFQLDLYARYSDSLKDMLLRRTCLLIDYEDANKALDKAKPPKLQAAEEQKEAAEKAYENCTENARREMKLFLQQRLLSFEEGMTSFAESQIKTARDTYTLLMSSLSAVKQMN